VRLARLMRLLVTGASGLLGLNLCLRAVGTHEVMAVVRRQLVSTPFEIITADLLETEAFPRLLDSFLPEGVIHCAAAADLDYCEAHPDLARQLNSDLAGQVARECWARRIRLVHISTDAVFDGSKRGSYSERDEPRPQGVYATTKRDGEVAAEEANPDAVVVRVNFYGWSLSGRRSLGEFFVDNLSRGAAVRGFTDVVFCPAFVDDLASILLGLLESSLRGLYHAVGPEPMSKFDFGRAIAGSFGFDESLISPASVEGSGLVARRSHNLWLANSKLSTDLGQTFPSFSTGLERFHRQYAEGFPQKIRGYQQGQASEVRQ
jgi:dTDP-4-dehydrorhamnose reductase